jgi:hypothetical protein
MARLIHFVAVVACLLVAAGFVTFANDELDKGSKEQVSKLNERLTDNPAPSSTPKTEVQRERQHGQVREAIDDANDVLLAPFENVVESDNAWVQHGVPALLALVAYGLLLIMLANSLPKPKAHGEDWRTAES